MTLPKILTTVTLFSKILAIVLFVSLPFIGFYFGYQYHKNISLSEISSPIYKSTTVPESNPTAILSATPTTTLSTKNTPTTKPVQNGADLKDIRYTLPQGWTAEIKNDYLFISPVKSGGYYIKVYNYPQNLDRREYFCQLVDSCMKETRFTEIVIGNISGYKATPLDNSGGGPADLFAAKGNKFYIISSYGVPSSSEITESSQQFFDSLIF